MRAPRTLLLGLTIQTAQAAVADTCGSCVANGDVWCYNDNTCWAHDDPGDAKPGACPGSTHCAAGSGCDCTSCDDAQCLPATGCRDGAGFEEGVDYYGNDAGNVTDVTSAADCCAACTADPGCSFWTLATDDHVCFKKTSDAGRNPVTDRVSGPAQTPTPPSPSTEGSWKPIAVMSVPRQGLGIGVLDGALCAVGGFATSTPIASAEMYSPGSDSWSAIAPMSAGRNGVGVGVVDGMVYALGGGSDNDVTLASAEVYQTDIDSWSAIAPMSTPRAFLGVGVLDGLLYAIGGRNDKGRALASAEKYDPTTNRWAAIAPMATRREWLGVGVLDGQIYAIGGTNGFTLASAEVYHPATNRWEAIAPMPMGRSGLGIGVLGGQIYAVGGGGDASPAFASSVVYDQASDSWGAAVVPAPMSAERRLVGVGSLGGMIYAVGGAILNAVATAEVFDPNAAATYKCSNNQCVEQSGGVPKATCEVLCAPALYQCMNGTCVQQDHGVDKATCEQAC